MTDTDSVGVEDTIRGVRRDISIGPLATVSLAKAREKAHDIRTAVADGRDPAAERHAQRSAFKAPNQVNRFVNVYLNDEDIRFLKNLDTPVKEGDEISIVPAIAGGAV